MMVVMCKSYKNFLVAWAGEAVTPGSLEGGTTRERSRTRGNGAERGQGQGRVRRQRKSHRQNTPGLDGLGPFIMTQGNT